MKRSQGRKKGIKNFRKRFFCLSDTGLSYHKCKGEPPLCIIPPDELLAVERVDDDVFTMKFVSYYHYPLWCTCTVLSSFLCSCMLFVLCVVYE